MKPVMLALSVVVPLFNEQDSLRPLVSQLLEAVRPLGVAFELVLVDDGSKDSTATVLAELSDEVPRTRGGVAPPQIRPDSGHGGWI